MKGDSGLRGYYEKWQAVFESETKDIAGSPLAVAKMPINPSRVPYNMQGMI